MTKYMKEKDSNRVIRDRGKDYLLEYYDKKSGKWISDFELCRIYFGSLIVESISESEAKKLTEG